MTTGSTDGWQLDAGGAETYEEFLVPGLMDRWARDLVATADLQPGERVLDLACGTGIVTRHVAARVGREGAIVGVDLNPAMLDVARRVTSRLATPVRWERTSAETLPFEDGSFDAVLCQQGLQFFPDRLGALEEAFRVTASGGRLVVSTCRSVEHQPGYAALTEIITERIGIDAGDIVRSPYSLGDPHELRTLVTKAGFRDAHLTIVITPFRVPSAAALLQGETASSPLGDVFASLDADVVSGVVEELARRLAAHTDDDGVTFPFETLVLTAIH